MSRGCFIVFEGIDGSGKSEQYGRLTEKLRKDYNVFITSEPTKGMPIGNLIRQVLYGEEETTEEALALLFAADRVDHTERKIKPALEEGKIIISDRYVYSSLAYQSKGMNKELDLDWVKTINRFAITPDVVVFLDITPEEGQKRLVDGQIRVKDHTYFEDIVKQEKIRSVYYRLFNIETGDLWGFVNEGKKKKEVEISNVNDTIVLRIDGSLSKDRIHRIINKNIIKILREKRIEKIKKASNFNNKSLTQFTEK
jgi:dTMP kinase